MKNWTIGKRIIFGFACLIFISISLGLFAYSHLSEVSKSSKAIVSDALPGVYYIGRIESNLRQAQVLVFKHIMSEAKEEMVQFDGEIAGISRTNEQMLIDYEKTISRPKDRELFEQVKPALANYRQLREEVLKLSREQKQKEAFEAAKVQLKPAYDRITGTIEALIQFNKEARMKWPRAFYRRSRTRKLESGSDSASRCWQASESASSSSAAHAGSEHVGHGAG